MRPPLLALLALLSLLSLVAWGAAWPHPALAAALRHRLETRGSFVRLGRGHGERAGPEDEDEDEAADQPGEQSQPESTDMLRESESGLDGGDEQEFERMARPSFVRLGRMWLARDNRASSIRLGRRSGNTSFPTSYKRYRIRLKRSI